MPYQPKTKTFDVNMVGDQEAILKDLLHDCALAFNCRAIESDDENYSTGCTYFIRGNETPKTGLEQLAMDIFQLHTKGKTFNPALSGAEWWTQVIDEKDDIGVHWDRDYGMEEETGVHIYPQYATVTYFADKGSPTVIFDKEGTIDHSFEFVGSFRAMEFSRPRLLKHISFPGNLLHAAPSEVLFGDEEEGEEDEEDVVDLTDETDGERSPGGHGSKARDDNLASILAHMGQKRITFLVNIWLNHIPSQCVRCDEILFPQFHTMVTPDRYSLSPATNTVNGVNKKVFKLPDADCTRSVVLKFVANDLKYDVTLPLPSTQLMCRILDTEDNASLFYTGNDAIEISYSSDQDDAEEGSSEGDGSDDDEEAESCGKGGVETSSSADKDVDEVATGVAKAAVVGAPGQVSGSAIEAQGSPGVGEAQRRKRAKVA